MLALFIFVINIIWESLHYRLYVDLTRIPPAIHILIASFADLFLIAFIFFINSIFNKSINWIENPKKLDYLVIIISGIIISAGIESYSLSHGRWIYTELMPTIFGIGLSPLIQLFTSAIISLLAMKVIK